MAGKMLFLVLNWIDTWDEEIEKAVFTMVVYEDYLKTMLLIKLKKCKKTFKFENELFLPLLAAYLVYSKNKLTLSVYLMTAV